MVLMAAAVVQAKHHNPVVAHWLRWGVVFDRRRLGAFDLGQTTQATAVVAHPPPFWSDLADNGHCRAICRVAARKINLALLLIQLAACKL